jgi:hypothetical protein
MDSLVKTVHPEPVEGWCYVLYSGSGIYASMCKLIILDWSMGSTLRSTLKSIPFPFKGKVRMGCEIKVIIKSGI